MLLKDVQPDSELAEVTVANRLIHLSLALIEHCRISPFSSLPLFFIYLFIYLFRHAQFTDEDKEKQYNMKSTTSHTLTSLFKKAINLITLTILIIRRLKKH